MVDVGKARAGLQEGQVLVVSVVASPEAGWGIEEVAADFALCAEMAVAAGAQIVEANLSCPNVCTAEADLYLSAEASGKIAALVRSAVGPAVPVLLKVGLFETAEQMAGLVAAVRGVVNGISATNSITAKVASSDGELLFGGLRRGIGGAVITQRCLEETRVLAGLTRAAALELVSVGGVCTGQDVRDRLDAGASHVQVATAAMIDPLVGIQMRRELAA
jgi:dihydroorotate dehydrogenase